MNSKLQMNRIKRYRDKLNIILKRTNQITEWSKDYIPEEFVVDEKTKLATYKAFQEIAESCMDITAMMCKDSKIVPKDDYTNIESLQERGIVSEKVGRVLFEANGLRNRLVHLYNKTDDAIAFDCINNLLVEIEEFVKVVEKWIREQLRRE